MPGSLEEFLPISASPVGKEHPPGRNHRDGDLDGEEGGTGIDEKDALTTRNVNDYVVEDEEPQSLELPKGHVLGSSVHAALTSACEAAGTATVGYRVEPFTRWTYYDVDHVDHNLPCTKI